MTHWKKLTNPNYLGAYSIGDGADLILTIKSVSNEMVIGTDGKKEECVVCHWQENEKPMILNSTNMKTISKLLDTPFIEKWTGHKVQIGIEKAKAFGEVVDALRIRKTLPKVKTEKAIACEMCGQPILAINSLTSEQVAAYGKKKYGKSVCAECGKKLNTEQNNAE